jgi:hypothetical protein
MEAYNGGDYNGVSCRNILANASEITEGLKDILLSKKKLGTTDDAVIKKVGSIEQLLGLIYGAMASLMLVHPSEEEKARAQLFVESAMTKL